MQTRWNYVLSGVSRTDNMMILLVGFRLALYIISYYFGCCSDGFFFFFIIIIIILLNRSFRSFRSLWLCRVQARPMGMQNCVNCFPFHLSCFWVYKWFDLKTFLIFFGCYYWVFCHIYRFVHCAFPPFGII